MDWNDIEQRALAQLDTRLTQVQRAVKAADPVELWRDWTGRVQDSFWTSGALGAALRSDAWMLDTDPPAELPVDARRRTISPDVFAFTGEPANQLLTHWEQIDLFDKHLLYLLYVRPAHPHLSADLPTFLCAFNDRRWPASTQQQRELRDATTNGLLVKPRRYLPAREVITKHVERYAPSSQATIDRIVAQRKKQLEKALWRISDTNKFLNTFTKPHPNPAPLIGALATLYDYDQSPVGYGQSTLDPKPGWWSTPLGIWVLRYQTAHGLGLPAILEITDVGIMCGIESTGGAPISKKANSVFSRRGQVLPEGVSANNVIDAIRNKWEPVPPKQPHPTGTLKKKPGRINSFTPIPVARAAELLDLSRQQLYTDHRNSDNYFRPVSEWFADRVEIPTRYGPHWSVEKGPRGLRFGPVLFDHTYADIPAIVTTDPDIIATFRLKATEFAAVNYRRPTKHTGGRYAFEVTATIINRAGLPSEVQS